MEQMKKTCLATLIGILFGAAVAQAQQTVGPAPGTGTDYGFFEASPSNACIRAQGNSLPGLQALADAQCAPATAKLNKKSIKCVPRPVSATYTAKWKFGGFLIKDYIWFGITATCVKNCTIDYRCPAEIPPLTPSQGSEETGLDSGVVVEQVEGEEG